MLPSSCTWFYGQVTYQYVHGHYYIRHTFNSICYVAERGIRVVNCFLLFLHFTGLSFTGMYEHERLSNNNNTGEHKVSNNSLNVTPEA